MYIIKVYGVAGNKIDRYLEEAVPNKEGEEFAKKIGGFFKATSAKSNTGIIDLFKELGKRYIDPNYRYLKKKEYEELMKVRSNSVRLNETVVNKNKNKKWYFC